MKFGLRLAVLLLLGCSFVLAQTPPSHDARNQMTPVSSTMVARPLEKPVARINGTELTERDLLREMYAIFPYARQHNGTFPKAMEADIRRGALKMIEFEELVYQEALRRHMTVAPQRLEKAELQFRKQFTTEAQFQEFLKVELKGSHELLRNKIRRALLIEFLLKADVADKSTVTLTEVRAFYDQNTARFKIPESYSLQSISSLPPKNAAPEQMKEVRKRAENALRLAKETKNYEEFGVLAEKISEDDYRVVMGDHKAVDVAQLPPPILAAAMRLQTGQVSDVIQVEQVCTIIRLNGHNPARMQNFAEVKDSLKQELRREKTDKLRAQLDEQLRKNAKIEEL